MRADERQAAVAYAYAWWMTGDDDAAAAALRSAMAADDPPVDSPENRLVGLTTAVRAHLGDARPMPPASELALLHDGFGLPLEAAAALAGVVPAQAADHLAHGRLEALLETVREEFRHPERLGGLATGNAADLEHAEQCRSCARARTLFERGARELHEVSAVSAPAGLIPALVAQYAPAVVSETPPALEAEADTPPAADETVAVHDLLDAPRNYEGAGDDVLDEPQAPETAAPSVEELEAMLRREAPTEAEEAEVEEAEVEEAEVEETEVEEAEAPVEEAEEAGPAALAPDRVPTTPARKRTAGVLAVAGILTLSALVVVWTASGGPEDVPGTSPDVDPPAVGSGGNSERPTTTASEGRFGPKGRPKGFSVTAVGLLVSGSQDLALSGTTIAPDDSLRIAVDYLNGSKGVDLYAVWRVDDETYQRLNAVVTSRASRHVWGVPVPEDGWPPGRHRIVVTADDSVAGAIDFTVKAHN